MQSTIAGFAEKRVGAFSRETDGRSLQGEACRNHQDGNSLQTPFLYLYVLSFLKRKYERKQFGRSFRNLPVVQGGAFLPRQLHQSKGGSAVRILKCFLIVRGFGACVDGRRQEFFLYPTLQHPYMQDSKTFAQNQ